MSEKTKCAVCGSADVQICLPAWFDPDTLKHLDTDADADELMTYCNQCGDCTALITPDGKIIIGRWQ